MKELKVFAMVLWLALTSVCLVSCGGDDDEPNLGTGLIGWYICKSDGAVETDFDPINVAIENDELLYETRYNEYYASRDLFFHDNGMWHDTEHKHGRFRFLIDSQVHVIRIIDDTTLVEYYAWLYEKGASGAKGMDVVYKIYAGSIFGELNYCDDSKIMSYVKVDNKIVTSEGTILTIMNGGLVEEGSSMSNIMEKYDPTEIYGKNEYSTEEYDKHIAQLIAENVSIKETTSEDEFIYKYEVTSTLHMVLPDNDIKFGIGHGYIAGGTENVTLEKQNHSYSYTKSGNKIIMHFENPFWNYYTYGPELDPSKGASIKEYYRQYKALESVNWRELSDTEKEQFENLKEILFEYFAVVYKNYEPSIQICIDGRYFKVIQY